MRKPVIETIGLTKELQGRLVVDDLNLTVFEGDVYGFLGPNGAGKSTTIRMLTGLVRPTKGTVRILGNDLRTNRVSALTNIGALVETPSFYKYLSARENLQIFCRLSGNRDDRCIDEVLDIVGLLERANDKVKNFSHGMIQKLGIAQALLSKPKVIILDEPTSGLDPQGMYDIRRLIMRLSTEQKVTVFLSSHLLHEVEQVCTRVGIINHGKLKAEVEIHNLPSSLEGQTEFWVDDAAKASAVLSSQGWARVVERGPGFVVTQIPCGYTSEANKALIAAGVNVTAIIPRSPSLEDVFLRLTTEAEGAN